MLLFSYFSGSPVSSGQVAFVVATAGFELYSPNGRCQYTLPAPSYPSSPVGRTYLTLTLMDHQILSCGGFSNLDCYLYDVPTDTWSIYSASQQRHQYMHGVVHQGKIYLPDNTLPEVFDLSTQTWSTWPRHPVSSSYTCFVSWEGFILAFGGVSNQIYQFDPSTSSWTPLNPPLPPMGLSYNGCLVLPNKNVLLTGSSESESSYKKYSVYNVTSNTWEHSGYSANYLALFAPVLLGDRIFVIPTGYPTQVTEYVYANDTCGYDFPPMTSQIVQPVAALAVPADWFSHLPNGCQGV